MKVNLLIVACGKYTSFLPDLIDSAFANFMTDCEVNVHVFTNHLDLIDLFARKEYVQKLHSHEIEYLPWPHPTLHRYHFFKQYQRFFSWPDADYYFYIDADSVFCRRIYTDILSPSTAVLHTGYEDKRGPYEQNPESKSYVPDNEGTHYYTGSFWGFAREEFWKFIDAAVEMVDQDEAKGIVPVWFDESVLNRYLIYNPPAFIAGPGYHCAEPYIFSLLKDHKKLNDL